MPVVSVIVVPMLETAVINNVASELLWLDSFTYQLPICVSGTLSGLTTLTSKFDVSTEAALASESFDLPNAVTVNTGKS